MQKFTNVRSTADTVLPLEMDEYHVIVNNGITEVNEEPVEGIPESGFKGWEIGEQIIYDKDEYIGLMSGENAELSETLTSILTDILPAMVTE